jgi:hypothetical protein
VETALGIREASSLAVAPGVAALAFGSIDFALDVGADETDDALLYARGVLVVASRSAGLPGPVDGVAVETQDAAAIRAAAHRSRSLGFGGKLSIHPAQVRIVEEAFAPAADELVWARRVVVSPSSTEPEESSAAPASDAAPSAASSHRFRTTVSGLVLARRRSRPRPARGIPTAPGNGPAGAAPATARRRAAAPSPCTRDFIECSARPSRCAIPRANPIAAEWSSAGSTAAEARP